MKYPIPRRTGTLFLVLALILSLTPSSLAADVCSIDPAGYELEVGAERDLTALLNGGTLPSGVTVEWSCEGAVTVTDSVGDFARIRADAVTESGKPAVVKAVFTRGEEKLGEAECRVTVIPARVTGVTLNKEALTLVEDGREKLEATVEPESAANKTVTWSTNNPAVARVANDGTVVGMGVGTATITVTTEDGEKTAKCQVTVTETIGTTSVQIDEVYPVTQTTQGKTLDLEREGQQEKLAVTVMPLDATDKSVAWSSSDEKIVTVSEEGRVTAVAPGIATVTASSKVNPNAVDQCEVTVSGLIISKTAVTLKVGQTSSVVVTGYGRASGRLEWTSDDPTVASGANNQVVGVSVGKTTVRVMVPGTNYEKEVEVTVEENTVRFDASVEGGSVLNFSGLLSRMHQASREGTTGKADLKSISSVAVDTKAGIIHYGYISPDIPNHGVGGGETYYVTPDASRGQQSISELKYIPAGDFSGTAIIRYVGCSTREETFNGTIYVTVSGSGDVMLSVAAGRPLELTNEEFQNICKLKTGRNASYITFTQPSAGRGTLYYNYSPGQYSQKVDSGTKYYLGSTPSLEKVTFVPAEGFTGTVSVPYRCTDTTGSSYSGTATITVYAASGSTASGGVEYTTGTGQRVTLSGSDFNSACLEQNDRSLSYIFFDELPDSSEGILYYNYTSSSSSRVDTATRYNRGSSSPSISSVTFVPASGFSGSVTIPYTGWDTSGGSYKDNLVIRVSDDLGTVYYSTDVDEPVTFRTEDFNEACQRANGASLNYVVFTLPSSRTGTLYRDYRSGSNTGTRLTSSTRCTRGGSITVSDVTFVPRDRYEGTVSIPFSGRDANGDLFEGAVSVSVGTGTGRVVSYSAASGGVVRFNAGDFNDACRSATGEDLSYLTFELPASRYGTLYYRYDTARGSGTVVRSSDSYYRSGGTRQIDDVSFVTANINGTASFRFTGRSTGGTRFTGTVEIAIGNTGLAGSYSSGTRYTGSATPVSLRTEDFRNACRTATGGDLAYIQLRSLPGEDTGRLYINYESPGRPGAPATTTSNYTVSSGLTIGRLSFVPKAGYQGQVSIPYTGYTSQGSSFSGSVVIDLSTSYCATPFYDMDLGFEWAKPSVEFLRYMGVTNGYSDGTFRPTRSINRGEFTLMVCRAFGFDTSAKVSSFPDVSEGSPYAGAVATAKSMEIVEGSGGLFWPNGAITRQSAMTILCRAMKAAGKKLPVTSGSTLRAYRDQARVAPYARESVAALVDLGVVQGNSDMQLDPTRAISRAEMAVILHRVLTL